MRSTDAHRDEGLAQCNDHDQTVALDEVLRANIEHGRNARCDKGRYELNHDRYEPTRVGRRSVEQSRAENEAGRQEVQWSEAREHVPPKFLPIKCAMHDDHEQVAETEGQTTVPESLGGGQRTDEEPGHSENEE